MLAPTVVTSGGSFSQSANASLSATIGESIITTAMNNNSILTQGFQQSYDQNIFVQPLNSESTNFHIFPNPAFETIYVEIISSSFSNFTLTLSDIVGKKIFSEQMLSNTSKEISLEQLQSGLYLITLRSNADKEFFSFKIIKI